MDVGFELKLEVGMDRLGSGKWHAKGDELSFILCELGSGDYFKEGL